MTIKKSDREKVYNNHNGHCVYCGKEITIKEMQVDHRIPKSFHGTDDISNLMSSCRRCNHYKRANSLEVFREYLKTIHNRLNDIYIFKVAIDYGIVKIQPFDGVFYFEKTNKESENN